MPAMNDTGIMKRKDGLDILITFPAPFIGLAPLKATPLHSCIQDWQTSHLTDTSGNLKALVITALTLPFPGKGNGYNTIDTVEKA